MNRGEKLQSFERSQVVFQGIGMTQVDQLGFVFGGLGQGLGIPAQLPAIRARQTRDYAQQAGFATAVGTTQPHQLARLQFKTQRFEKNFGAPANGEVLGTNARAFFVMKSQISAKVKIEPRL